MLDKRSKVEPTSNHVVLTRPVSLDSQRMFPKRRLLLLKASIATTVKKKLEELVKGDVCVFIKVTPGEQGWCQEATCKPPWQSRLTSRRSLVNHAERCWLWLTLPSPPVSHDSAVRDMFGTEGRQQRC